MLKKLRIGVLISGGGSNLQAIIDACKDGRIDGEVVFVGSDKAGVFGLERATEAGIPTFVVDYKKTIEEWTEQLGETWAFVLIKSLGIFGFSSEREKQDVIRKSWGIIPKSIPEEGRRLWLMKRFEAENRLLDKIQRYDFDLLILAGFMRNLSAFFIDRININPERPRIMNIHPALLPAFPGTDGYGDTYRYGCKIGGCTVHFVDYGEDTGPIIGQRAVLIHPDDTLESFKEKGLKVEWRLYPECIQLFAKGALKVVEVEGRKHVEIDNIVWKQIRQSQLLCK